MPAFGSLTIFVEPNHGLASGSFSKIQEPFMNLELQAYAKWSRSNSTTAPVCLHQNLFYYNCIDQNSRFMETGYRQKGKGYIGYMCFSWPSKNIWRDRSRYSFRQGGKQMVYAKQLWSASSDLSDRTQFVSCCGCGSSKREITYGVSQGSILGPTFVNVHINGTTGVRQYCYFPLCMLTILKFIRVQRTLIELRNKSIVIWNQLAARYQTMA